jgi:hypothetical protein
MLDTSVTEEELGVLSSRNPKRHYWQYLIVISLFVFLPVLQFTLFQENFDQIICYYNNKCIHSVGGIDAFNNIISNTVYVVLGLVFILTVKLSGNNETGCGIHRDHSLYYCMGICLVCVGIFSGLYHVCPSPLNFQFDTLYMYFSGALTFMAVYHKRHRDRIPTAFRTYLILAFIYYLNTVSLFHYKHGVGLWLWFVADLLIIYVLLHGTINLYFATDWSLLELFSQIKSSLQNFEHINIPKLILVCIINLFTITMIFYATFSGAYIFSNWFLSLFVINMVFYFTYYVIQKALKREIIKWYVWILLFLDIIVLLFALIFFEHAVTNKFMTHEESDHLNEPCVLFGYFDTHDIWHFLSAIGLYIFMNIIYFIDDDLKETPRSSISVF